MLIWVMRLPILLRFSLAAQPKLVTPVLQAVHRVITRHLLGQAGYHRPVRLNWAKLLKRMFEIDMEHGPNCGGSLNIIAAIQEQPVIEKVLTHLGQPALPRPRRVDPGHRCVGR